MGVFFQIFLINLAVSCDNIGVIALATKGLPPKQAKTARALGIWLSLLLKLVFVGIISFLFQIPWLHIRIIGGVLLLHVTFHMLRQSKLPPQSPAAAGRKGENGFFLALISIVAADVSMSLDNVIAILSVLTSGGQAVGWRQMLLVLACLLACVPLLLWLGGALSRLMERQPALVSLCGGYLAFTAFHMIFADELMALFFQYIRFSQTTALAVLCGVLSGLYGLFLTGEQGPGARRHNRLLALCPFVALYSVFSVMVICFLNTSPVVDGQTLSVELLYGFTANGASSVFAIGAATEFPILCAAVYTGVLLENREKKGFLPLLWQALGGMLLFVLLELAVTTLCTTLLFGWGRLPLPVYCTALVVQTALLCTYCAVFCLIGALIHNTPARITAGILFYLVEFLLGEMSPYIWQGAFWAGFFPSFYMERLPNCITDFWFVLRALLLSALVVGFCAWLGERGANRAGKAGRSLLPYRV